DCFMVYKVQRYDIKGKEILKSLCKYYITDTGLRNTLLGYRNIDSGHILETLIFLELKRRKYQIYTGKADNEEIDFVIKNQNEVAYIQVAETVKNPETLERELRPFRKLKDKYPCFLITLDKDFNKDYDGIKSVNAIDFLCGNGLG
ncbi:MAG: ATP-binding protein, partial [Treponema sp.]|nr:ATP-binding protein [Treponema sp.]